jgi:hypothetical protein
MGSRIRAGRCKRSTTSDVHTKPLVPNFGSVFGQLKRVPKRANVDKIDYSFSSTSSSIDTRLSISHGPWTRPIKRLSSSRRHHDHGPLVPGLPVRAVSTSSATTIPILLFGQSGPPSTHVLAPTSQDHTLSPNSARNATWTQEQAVLVLGQ